MADELRRLELEKALSEPDAVMEPNILGLLGQYVGCGGKPQTVVESLSDSYVGYAQMAHLLCNWLALVVNTDPAAATAGAAGSVDDLTSQYEVQFCQSLVKDVAQAHEKERFDSRVADTVFSKGKPLWLKELVEDPAGRSLIYDLSEKHRNCNLLSFAIQYIWHQGHEDEIKGLSSASAHFDVFHRLLSRRLLRLQQASAAELAEAVRELPRMCAYEQSCYLHASLLLRMLGREPGGERFKRMWQELESRMAADKGCLVWRMGNMFAQHAPQGGGGGGSGGGGAGGAGHAEGMESQRREAASRAAAEAYAAVGDMLGSDRAALGDVLKLHKMYSQPDPPAVDALRHAHCVEVLLSEVFDPNRALLPPDRLPAYLRLLGLAAAAVDGRSEGRGLDTSAVEPTERALRSLRELLEATKLGRWPVAEETAALLARPVVAMAAVHWARQLFSSRDFFLSSEGAASSKITVVLLAEVARQHLMHHAALIDLIARAFKAAKNTAAGAVSTALVDLSVLVMSLGSADRVLLFYGEYMAAAPEEKDAAVLARFAGQAVQVAGAPYSAAFAVCVARALGECGARRARGAAPGCDGALRAFAAEVGALVIDELSPKESAVLRELQTG